MKLVIITNYLGNRGGLGRYSKEVVKALKSFPLTIEVISEAKVAAESFEHAVLLPVFRQPKTTVFKNILLNIIRVRRTVKQADIVHAHDGWPYGLYAYCGVLGTKKKLFITGVGTYSVEPLKVGFRGYLLRRVYRRAEKIFCISDYVANKIKDLCPEAKVVTVFMGVTALPVVTQPLFDRYEKELSLTDRYPLVLTVGDIKHRKGQLDTLSALYLLKSRYPNFMYVMIGSGDDVVYVQAIKTYARDHGLENSIKIISDSYDDEVLSFFYSRCDLFMLNSTNDGAHFEGFGLVLLEAAQFGKPVIGSSDCGIENALKDRYNGYLAKSENPQDISEKVVGILEKDHTVFSENSLIFYKQFSWKTTAESYYNHYIL